MTGGMTKSIRKFASLPPLEREEIILNYVRVNSGKSVKVSFFAEQLAVSERTIQTALKNLENKGLIKRTPPPLWAKENIKVIS